jgi:hypothetical protein
MIVKQAAQAGAQHRQRRGAGRSHRGQVGVFQRGLQTKQQFAAQRRLARFDDAALGLQTRSATSKSRPNATSTAP